MRETPSIQRYHGVLMRSFPPCPANSHYTTRIHPALTSFADEVCATLARLFAYVGALAWLGIVGVHFFDLWSAAWGAAEPPVRAGWSAAGRSYPTFAVSPLDPPEKTDTYSILRHPRHGHAAPAGRRNGRGAVMSWLHQALRGARSAGFRVVVPGQRLAGAARGDCLHAEPADFAHLGE